MNFGTLRSLTGSPASIRQWHWLAEARATVLLLLVAGLRLRVLCLWGLGFFGLGGMASGFSVDVESRFQGLLRTGGSSQAQET